VRILITGASGGIGSHIAAGLATMTTLDGRPLHEIVTFDHNLADPGVAPRALAALGAVDVAILCASKRITPNEHPSERIAGDIAMTANTLDGVLAKRVIYLSSARVYEYCDADRGQLPETHQDEEEPDDPVVGTPPRDPIGLSKLVCERLVRAWARGRADEPYDDVAGRAFTIFRLFNVITPNEPHDVAAHVQMKLYRDLVVKQAPLIEMASSGLDARAWTWVGDVAEAIAGTIDDRRSQNRTYNLGADSAYTVRQLARAMLRVAKRLGLVDRFYEPAFAWKPGAAPPRALPIVARAQAELGFDPKTTLEECLEKFLLAKKGPTATP
jgi:nucleoside-diphosphate-sugar epimerase